MPRPNRRYRRAHFDLSRVREAAQFDQLVLTRKAFNEASQAFPADVIEIESAITDLIAGLDASEFQFSERRGDGTVDVYRIACEGVAIWLKLKIEKDTTGSEQVVIISFHEWDDSRLI